MTSRTNLTRFPIHANVAISDLDEARSWYEEKMGLVPDQKDPGGFWYQFSDDTWLHIYKTDAAGTAENTVAGITVTDIEDVMTGMKDRGVEFEEYESTEDGLATFESAKVAWFKDLDGNIYELSETR